MTNQLFINHGRFVRKATATVVCTIIVLCHLQAQIGGRSIFPVLQFAPSARVTALGGTLIAVSDGDLSLAALNPALLDKQAHQALTFNHRFHPGGITASYFAYGHHSQRSGLTWQLGVQHAGYGEFEGLDEFRNPLGPVSASETAFLLGISKPLYERLSLGATLKVVNAMMGTYGSWGMATDLGAWFHVDESKLAIGLVFRNLGSQLTTFGPDNREAMPLDIQLGLSKRLQYLPFRFSITATNLQRWNLVYDNPNSVENTPLFDDDESSAGQNAFERQVDNFFRHLVFSGEFLFGQSENVRLRFAYNHLRRQELSVQNLRSMAGFSVGLGIRLARFQVSFGHEFFHLAGGATHFTFSTTLGEFLKSK